MKVESKKELREIIGLKELTIRELVDENNELEDKMDLYSDGWAKCTYNFYKYKKVSKWWIIIPTAIIFVLGFLFAQAI